MTNPSSKTFRDYLGEAFQDRKTKNSRYSPRAFARDLDLAPSTLSEVLSD